MGSFWDRETRGESRLGSSVSFLSLLPGFDVVTSMTSFFISSSRTQVSSSSESVVVTSNGSLHDRNNYSSSSCRSCCDSMTAVKTRNNNEQSSSNRKTRNRKQLVTVKEVPAYLQFNQYILNGYRPPNLSYKDCLKSLFYFHNESVNIFTHGKVSLIYLYVFLLYTCSLTPLLYLLF